MQNSDKNFEIERTFGIGVLLKLIKGCHREIKISTQGNKFVSNVSREKLAQAAESVMKAHRIHLKYR